MSFILELIIGKVSISLLINLIVQSLIKSSRLLENLKINKFDINYNFLKKAFCKHNKLSIGNQVAKSLITHSIFILIT
jgi:hypothetical protein